MTSHALAQLITNAAFIWQTTPDKIIGHNRSRANVQPRHAVCLVARQIYGISYPQIAAGLGGRDHSTIIHALDAAASLIDHDEDFKERVARLRASVTQAENTAEPQHRPVHEAAGIGRLATRLRELARYEPARFDSLKAAILQ
jgi:hypothetical protein